MCVKDYFTQSITIKRATYTANAKGERIPTWTTQATIKGTIRVMSAHEMYLRDKLVQNVSHVMYYDSSTPNNDDRVEYKSETYLIKAIENKTVGYPMAGYYKAFLQRVEVEK